VDGTQTTIGTALQAVGSNGSAVVGMTFYDGASTSAVKSTIGTVGDTFVNFSDALISIAKNPFTPVNGSTTFGNSWNIFVEFSVPIAEWKGAGATFLAAIPVQRTVYIKDVKAAGADGGTFTSGAWQTRTLNTIEYLGSSATDSGSGASLGFASIASNVRLGRV